MKTHVKNLVTLVAIWLLTLVALIVVCNQCPAQSAMFFDQEQALRDAESGYWNDLYQIERELDTCDCAIVIINETPAECKYRVEWLEKYMTCNADSNVYMYFNTNIQVKSNQFIFKRG